MKKTLVTNVKWHEAIEYAVLKTKQNLSRYNQKFPHISNDKCYEWGDNEDWIEGFWTGIVWLCYEYSGDEYLRLQANSQIASFHRRLQAQHALEHHDIGFLYGLSALAGWIVEEDERHKLLALQAADHLLGRWRETSGLIQAWGPEDDSENGGRIIIDCLMNLPLLYWASSATGNPRYAEVAVRQAELSRKFLVRGDDSSYHTFYFDRSGNSLRGGTHQGYSDGSTWTRGQAWGIYGFALSYRQTGNINFLETSKRLAAYFIERIPADGIVYWDFDVPVTGSTSRDSSASAIAACGMLELLEHLAPDDPQRQRLEDAVLVTMTALAESSMSMAQEKEGLIDHGSYHVRGSYGLDGYMIWGDYFYLEALMRLEKQIPGYWYERGKSLIPFKDINR
ncbi:glycoside hydrolase family 88 protein [Paenibacillus sp. FSL R5-0749]|uniref:glycoside hydrolase family 88 protein n=1 Tax=Paenibacillus sp. FSL R5-0749 TaxID=2921657 RepID=UPI00315A8632